MFPLVTRKWITFLVSLRHIQSISLSPWNYSVNLLSLHWDHSTPEITELPPWERLDTNVPSTWKKFSDKSLRKVECKGFKHGNFIYAHVLGTWSPTFGDGIDGCGTVGRWHPLQDISQGWTLKVQVILDALIFLPDHHNVHGGYASHLRLHGGNHSTCIPFHGELKSLISWVHTKFISLYYGCSIRYFGVTDMKVINTRNDLKR